MADDDLEVTVTDEPGDKQPGDGAGTTTSSGTTTTAEPKTGTDGVDDGVAELQRKLDESERARVVAERERDAAFQRAGTAEATAHGSQMAIILGALETIDANRATLEAQYEEALAAGEFKKASQINSQLVDQAAQKVELVRGKAALEAQGRQPARQPLDDNAKVELYVQNMKPRAAAWVRAHAEYVTDPRKNQQLLARHYSALAAGHEEGGDDYFKFIESGLGTSDGGAATTATPAAAANGAAANGAGTDTALSAAAQPTQRRDVQPSPASPSRGGGSTRTVRLTPAQQEAARMSGLTNEEYARNMVREQQAGNIGKTRVH